MLKFHKKYFYPYVKKYDFCKQLKFSELLDLRAHVRQSDKNAFGKSPSWNIFA